MNQSQHFYFYTDIVTDTVTNTVTYTHTDTDMLTKFVIIQIEVRFSQSLCN